VVNGSWEAADSSLEEAALPLFPRQTTLEAAGLSRCAAVAVRYAHSPAAGERVSFMASQSLFLRSCDS
jgi:hypothetical protein